jgi:hypothetical protein
VQVLEVSFNVRISMKAPKRKRETEPSTYEAATSRGTSSILEGFINETGVIVEAEPPRASRRVLMMASMASTSRRRESLPRSSDRVLIFFSEKKARLELRAGYINKERVSLSRSHEAY